MSWFFFFLKASPAGEQHCDKVPLQRWLRYVITTQVRVALRKPSMFKTSTVVQLPGADCTVQNCLYLVSCLKCSVQYVGKCSSGKHGDGQHKHRISEHRRSWGGGRGGIGPPLEKLVSMAGQKWVLGRTEMEAWQDRYGSLAGQKENLGSW